ncbi:MAG: hypothetical protein V4574_12190 [Pseudomonadota bacterium]
MPWKILALGALLLTGPDGAALTLAPNRTLAATIGGKPATLRVDPGAPSAPIFNAEAAARLGFRPSMIAVRVAIGPVRVGGSTDLVALDIGGGEFKRRAAWFEGAYAEGADAVIGPGGLPAGIVRFELRAPAPGERTVTLPLADFGRSGMGATLVIGGETVAVRFSLERDRSVATASGGAIAAAAQGGAFDGEPEKMLIRFGVERPVRHMKLATPLQVGPFALAGLMVRTSDFGSTARIPEADAPEGDPDEIVVVGEKKSKKREQRIEIGRDYLDRCSSITFDKPGKRLTFSCL